MLRKVKLYGQLAKFIGKRVLKADVSSAGEAIRFLVTNWPEVEHHMMNQQYRVEIDGSDIALDEVHHPAGTADIKIIPVVGGAGGRNGRMILIGAALIGASFLFPGAGMFGTYGTGAIGGGTAAAGAGTATATAGAAWAITAGTMISAVGASMILSGVAGMLTPTPGVPDSTDDPQNSFSFSGVQNSARAGIPVPICYGEVITGSVTISAEIDVTQVAT